MKISANIMMKNEERCIYRCIKSIYNFVDEIIVADTGSSDNSMEIIKKKFGDKIKLFRTKWNDDFSEIRNYMIKKSTNPIIFQIDADEYLEDYDDYNRLREQINSKFNRNQVISIHLTDSNGSISPPLKRIFFNSNDFTYYGYIHEELRYKNKPIEKNSILNVKMYHDGYKPYIIEKKDKNSRNIFLSKKMVDKNPSNPRWLFFLIRDLFFAKEDQNDILELIHKFSNLPDTINKKKYKGYTKLIEGIILSRYSNLVESKKIMKQLKKEFPNNIDYIYLGLLNIDSQINDLKKNTLNYIDDLINLETFNSFLNSNGDHIKIELFWKLFSFLEFEKAILVLDNIDQDLKKELILEKLTKITCLLKNKMEN